MSILYGLFMTKQDSVNRISKILHIETSLLGSGSTLKVEWLHRVLAVLSSDEIDKDTDLTKHDYFDEIVKQLGGENQEEYKDKNYTSTQGTITTAGTDYVLELLELWKKLWDSMPVTREKLVPSLFTEEILEHHLPVWIQTNGLENIGNWNKDFHRLSSKLIPFAMFNSEFVNILSPEYLNFCIHQFSTDKDKKGREEDSNLSVGDASEDEPAQLNLSQRIDPDLSQPDVGTIMGRIGEGLIDLDPPWQRKRVWSESKQRKLIRSVILGLPLPSFILFQPKGSYMTEVIDGKQRLSSLHDFVEGRIKFPRVFIDEDVNLGLFTLRDCSEKYFDDLPMAAKVALTQSRIHTSTLKEVEPETVYEIFTIYNSTGTRLNSVEIRNAAYQNHEVHKLMVSLSGEQTEESQWDPWTRDLRYCVGNSNLHQNRYKYLAFIERYLGYSRGYNEDGKSGFKKLTTTKSIKSFYDHEDGDDIENAKVIRNEVVTVFSFGYNELDNAFTISGKFHALKSTNSLILCRLIIPLINQNSISNEEAVVLLDSCIKTVIIPDNQNTSTIWNMHIGSIANLWEHLSTQQKQDLDKIHSSYLDLLLPGRNETEE